MKGTSCAAGGADSDAGGVGDSPSIPPRRRDIPGSERLQVPHSVTGQPHPTPRRLSQLLCCPTCHAGLHPLDNALACSSCKRSWPVINGIPLLLNREAAAEYGLAPNMDHLNEVARSSGWQAAAMAHAQRSTRPSYAHEYVTSEARADFKILLPPGPNGIVADIGSGWGNISTAFARTHEHVYAVDTTLANLEFVQTRAHQERLANVTPVLADAGSLPLPAGSCLIAIMAGVLEWVPWGRRGAPMRLQLSALEAVRRSLQPGGWLYIGIENRISAKAFLGAREPHTGLRFVSLMPRRLADLYSRLVRKAPFREYTHTPATLTRMLHHVGYTGVRVYYPVPGYQRIRFLSALDDPVATRFLLRQLKIHPRYGRLHHAAARFSIALGLLGRVAPSLAVVARKPE